MGEATKTTKQVSDLQNELLVKNAEMLKQGNAEVRREMERGVYDIDSIEKANALMIATIEETITIAREGKAQRQAAITKLDQAEAQLASALKNAG
jgi:uncharacterized protein YaaN involved in tellurite resistance